ncbi:tellurite resistance protein TehB [Deinococcus aerius]|uniref:Tellurite resistance protein TehB n=1 Tax=Deinococcus aerius TaxID=200253 RepID=A0A2I9CTK7_9DEIO|nr:class I SAM-dependent methyltransferase [Deinococcus aerius]GBF05113.1 tellurite resistance protein TehB [Deinococcus aerius]
MSDDHWGEYARATRGGPPRPLLLEVLAHLDANLPPGRALDLGSGAGNDSLELLRRGWLVTALDRNAEAPDGLRAQAGDLAGRLTTVQGSFQAAPRRRYRLVYASLSLPFCPPENFGRTLRGVVARVGVGGWFAATLFDVRDGWAERADMTFVTPQDLGARLEGLSVEVLREEESTVRLALGGEHHSHLLTVIARRPTYGPSV